MDREADVRLSEVAIDLNAPTVLYRSGTHRIYWLGITEETAFRCNVYLIEDGAELILVDPGSRRFFAQIRDRVAQIAPPQDLTGMVLCHQDPDVAASMVEWLDVNPAMRVFSTPRTHVLLPHYGRDRYNAYDVSASPRFELPSGHHLRFIEAPFLHFPGAFVTYATQSRYLFSGDIWAALDVHWRLTVESFEKHVAYMDLFHVEYMASNIAARGFVRRIEGLVIDAILPQHGSLLEARHVGAALDYLRNLQCGLDLIYADLSP